MVVVEVLGVCGAVVLVVRKADGSNETMNLGSRKEEFSTYRIRAPDPDWTWPLFEDVCCSGLVRLRHLKIKISAKPLSALIRAAPLFMSFPLNGIS